MEYEITLHEGEIIRIPVRLSMRCRRMTLRLKENGFELVCPPGMPAYRVETFLKESRAWLRRTLVKRRTVNAQLPPKERPQTVFLPFTGENLTVVYSEKECRWCAARSDNSTLTVTGMTGSYEACSHALREWLIAQAETTLLPYAREIAEKHGFPVSEFRTGIQKRTWGTCTSQRVVTLNALLLFFTKSAAEYVILHEFCHLYEMNHSKAFWKRLEELYPGAKQMRQVFKNAIRSLPAWSQK